MKKILVSMVALMSTIAAMAQVITFSRTEHDFGKINEADGRVSTIFEFKNEGMEPLVLSNVRASCGCTTPKWPREPIEPGQVGQITVTYNPNGRPGRFQKTITVTSNATDNATAKLYIKGEVIPKPAKPVNQYPVKMGELSLKSKSINFGSIKKGENGIQEIEYANQTEADITVDLLTADQDHYLISEATLTTIKKGESGKLRFALDSKVCPIYGPVATKAYVVVNGKRQMTDEYKIDLTANIVEDFSSLSVADRQNAPIIEINSEINLGTLGAAKRIKKGFTLQNAGANPLLVRRVYCNDSSVELSYTKAIKSGKKGDVKFAITTAKEPGKYSRELQVITNDPVNPVKKVNLTWTVE